ncbi:uncharacterized protein VTP21DRAFT_2371 [Calcarisporiella thermophila]|uniref:uncharacterized protein n=1 Tax=Calcarisporiella thermophila TaxID=911321 RepID=UPI0037431A1E
MQETHSNGCNKGIPSFQKLVVYTGNLIQTGTAGSNTSLRKSNTELVKSLKDTFSTSMGSEYLSFCYDEVQRILEVPDIRDRKAPDEERSDIDITVKFFYLPCSDPNHLNRPPPEYISEALSYLEKLLGSNTVDTLILSFSGVNFYDFDEEKERDDIDKKILVWRELEKAKQNGHIKTLGISEFSKSHLEVFLKSGVNVPPAVNQVNLDDCCAIPQDLMQFAREQNIELLTHGDCSDILPASTLDSILREHKILSNEKQSVVPRWVIRYSAVIQSRGIVADRGYIIMASDSGCN